MTAYVVFNSDNKVIAVVYDTVNNELDIDNVKTESTTAAKTITNNNASITKTGESGAYTVSVAANAKPGTTVTVTVQCTVAPGTDKTDTVTVKFGSESKTLTFTATGTQSVTFTMGNAAVDVNTTVATK